MLSVSAATYEMDDFHRIAIVEDYVGIGPARYDGTIQFDGDAVAAIAFFFEERLQILSGRGHVIAVYPDHSVSPFRVGNRKNKKAARRITPKVVYPFVRPLSVSLYVPL